LESIEAAAAVMPAKKAERASPSFLAVEALHTSISMLISCFENR
jgi:hypothetical protein